MSTATLERTHAWNEGPFAWKSAAVARLRARDGATEWSLHEDGALVAWEASTGRRRAVLLRGAPEVRSAVFVGEDSVAVLRYGSLELWGLDGVLRWRKGAPSPSKLLEHAGGDALGLTVGWGYGTNYAFSLADGAELARSPYGQRWLALADTARVTVVRIPDPDPPPAAGHDAAGDPIYPPDHPTFELRLEGSAGELLRAWPLAESEQHNPTALFSLDGRCVFLFWAERLVALELATGVERWERRGRLHLAALREGALLVYDYTVTAAPRVLLLRPEDGAELPAPSLPATHTNAPATPLRSIAVTSAGDAVAWVDSVFGVSATALEGEPRRVLLPGARDALFAPEDGALWTGGVPTVRWDWRASAAPEPRPERTRPSLAPWRASPSGARLLLCGSPSCHLALFDGEGALLDERTLSWSATDAFFESEEELRVVYGSYVERFDVARGFERMPGGAALRYEGYRQDNLAVALGSRVALVADRTLAFASLSPHDYNPPEVGRLRVVSFGPSGPQERFELRRWGVREPHGAPVLAVSPDGALGFDAMLALPQARLWDLTTGALLATLDLSAEEDTPTCAAFSADGSVLALGTAAGRALRLRVQR